MKLAKPDLAIITVARSVSPLLIKLRQNLLNLSSSDFTWIIKLSEEPDKDFLKASLFNPFKTLIHFESDLGIYDALNQALVLCDSEYYLVLGDDDSLHYTAIEDFFSIFCIKKVDLYSFAVDTDRGRIFPRSGLGWLYGMNGCASCHSCGLIISRALHNKFGLYSLNYGVFADQFFVKRSIALGASICRFNFPLGYYSLGGSSSIVNFDHILFMGKMQYDTEKYKRLQILFLVIRLLRFCFRKQVLHV